MLLNKPLVAILLSAPMALAHAGAWNFQYQGFYDPQIQAFDDSMVLSGWFAGVDLDANDVISASELTALHIDGINYLACGGPLTCVVPAFAYAGGANLDFSVARFYRDSTLSVGYGIVTGDKINTYVTEDGNTNYMAEWHWTDATTLSVSPVPEPAAWMTLAGGALLLAGRRARVRAGGPG